LGEPGEAEGRKPQATISTSKKTLNKNRHSLRNEYPLLVFAESCNLIVFLLT
jgi:hypothetical protein